MTNNKKSKEAIEKENEEIRLALLNILEDVKESEEELKENKNFYENILESTITGVWVTDKTDRITYANKGMGEIAGIPPKKIEGARVLKDFSESTLKFFRPHYLNAKKVLKPHHYTPILVVTPAGRQSYQSGWLIPMIKNKKYNGMICTIEDVTEQRKAELKLLKQKEDYEKEIIRLNLKISKLEDKKRTPKQLSRFQRDTLKEIASIGANSASTALSKLTNKFITVNLTKLNIMSFNDVTKYYDGKKNIGVLFEVKGGVSGAMITLCSEKSTLTISDLINGNKSGTTKKLTKENEDLIKEVGNILVGAYLSALSNMSKINMLESTPTFMIDSTDKILKKGMKKIKKKAKEVIFIENVLIIGKKRIKQEIILILMPDSLDKLFKSLFKDL